MYIKQPLSNQATHESGSDILAVRSLLWDPSCGILAISSWPKSLLFFYVVESVHGRGGSDLTPPVLEQIRQNPYRASTVWGITNDFTN